MSTRKKKGNPKMARSKSVCREAAKQRWANYWKEKEILANAYASGILTPPDKN
jgi:hypothetical protein